MWIYVFCFFFFKQKTAYEMRMRDWSSDVCSSDLLSRGMSYKNAMAGLPMGGGKAVILRDDDGKGEARLEAFGRMIESLGGRYVTAEDVGMTDEDMRVIARRTRHVSGLPVAEGAAGGN